jgi:hypothetical protein
MLLVFEFCKLITHQLDEHNYHPGAICSCSVAVLYIIPHINDASFLVNVVSASYYMIIHTRQSNNHKMNSKCAILWHP